MKHLSPILAILLILASCSKDEQPEIITETNQISINFEEEYQITATANEAIEYTSKDEFHATVSENGLVKGGKVGQTEIILQSGKAKKTIKVNIEPLSTLYPEPFLKFGASKSEVKKELDTPIAETDDSFMLNVHSDAVTNVVYSFKNNKLTGVLLTIDKAYNKEFALFLTERYVQLSGDNLIFVDNTEPSKTTLSVFIMPSNTWSNFVIYTPYQN